MGRTEEPKEVATAGFPLREEFGTWRHLGKGVTQPQECCLTPILPLPPHEKTNRVYSLLTQHFYHWSPCTATWAHPSANPGWGSCGMPHPQGLRKAFLSKCIRQNYQLQLIEAQFKIVQENKGTLLKMHLQAWLDPGTSTV